MSRVLLTGATGFVGRQALAALIRDGHEVHALARRAGPELAGVAWHEIDLLAEPAGVARVLVEFEPETLVHLAWYAEHGKFWSAPENLDWMAATLGLVRGFAASAGARRVVMAGTCAEYDWSRSVYSEDAPCAPATLYGAAKHGLRLVAEAFLRDRGLSLAWGRLFFLYGPGEAPGRFVPAVARSLLDGGAAPMTEGTQLRDFLHTTDAGEAFAALAAADLEGPVNIASGAGVRLRDLAGLIAEQVGGPGHLEVGAIPARPGDPPSLVADIARMGAEVGWRPRIALADGIAETVAWCRQQRRG